MADQQRSSVDSVIENIFRWPMEGWTKKQIQYLLFAHRLNYRSHHTKDNLLTILVAWARSGRSAIAPTDRIKTKVRRAHDEMVEAGFEIIPTHVSSRHYLFEEMMFSRGSFRATRRRYDEHNF